MTDAEVSEIEDGDRASGTHNAVRIRTAPVPENLDLVTYTPDQT